MSIWTGLPITELLAGLAEEASELAQAALKLRRVYDGTNPTPVSKETAQNNLLEEIADVRLYLEEYLIINWDAVQDIMEFKSMRWQERLKGAGRNERKTGIKSGSEKD